jgi:hypothetical protein
MKSNREYSWICSQALALGVFWPVCARNGREDPSQDAHISRFKAGLAKELPEGGHHVVCVRVIEEPDVPERLLQTAEEVFEILRPGERFPLS